MQSHGVPFAAALRVPAFLLLFVAAAQPARAQRATPEGNFLVQSRIDPATGTERGTVTTFPVQRGAGEGMLTWTCAADGGVFVGVWLEGGRRADRPKRTVWRFDQDEPVASALTGLDESFSWFLPADQVVPFTARARTAARLVLRTARGGGGQWVHEYDLAGAAAALERLACTREPRASEPARPWQAPVPEVPAAPPTGEGTYEISAIEEMPRIRNAEAVSRFLSEGAVAALGPGAEAKATVRFRLLESGRVDAPTVLIVETTNPAANELLTQAAARFVMSPARVNNRPVRVWLEIPLTVATPEAASTPAPPRRR